MEEKTIYTCPMCEAEVDPTAASCKCGAEFEPVKESKGTKGDKKEEVTVSQPIDKPKDEKKEEKTEEPKEEKKEEVTVSQPIKEPKEEVTVSQPIEEPKKEVTVSQPIDKPKEEKSSGKTIDVIYDLLKEPKDVNEIVTAVRKSSVRVRNVLKQLISQGKVEKKKEDKKFVFVRK